MQSGSLAGFLRIISVIQNHFIITRMRPTEDAVLGNVHSGILLLLAESDARTKEQRSLVCLC